MSGKRSAHPRPDDSQLHQDSYAHRLPEGEKNDALNHHKFGQRPDGRKLCMRCSVHQDQAVQCPALRRHASSM